MTVTVYRSTDTGAPVLTGQAGSLLTLLDAVLVDGYNAGSPAGAGWTKAFTKSGNIGIYRMATSGNTGYYLHVDDSGTNNTAKEAMMVGACAATALNTITQQFPTAALLNLYASTPTGGVMCRKSTTADATARAWTVVASNSTFYLFIETGDVAIPVLPMVFAFGDFFTLASGEANNCMIIGRNGANTGTSLNEMMAQINGGTTLLANSLPGHFIAGQYTQTGAGGTAAAIVCGKHIELTKMGSTGGASASGTTAISGSGITSLGNNQDVNSAEFPFPNGPDGGLYVSPIWLHHNGIVRGYLKGLWAPLHDRCLNHNDTVTGAGAFSGKSFLAQNMTVATSSALRQAQCLVETSDTWS